jgi:hypothetical protein
VWVGHSCATLLVLVLISRAAGAGAFYLNGSGQECPLYTNAQRLKARWIWPFRHPSTSLRTGS